MHETTRIRALHISQRVEIGGASVAAHSISQAVGLTHVDSTIISPKVTPRSRMIERCEWAFSRVVQRAGRHPHYVSLDLLGSMHLLDVNRADIAHLHFTSTGAMSAIQISRISVPIVWTLHDIWPFMGAQHVDIPGGAVMSLVNHASAKMKAGLWSELDPILVFPSHKVQHGAGLPGPWNDWESCIIPNPVDTSIFKFEEVPRNHPKHEFALLVASVSDDPNKGVPRAIDAIREARRTRPNLQLVIAGRLGAKRHEEFWIKEVGFLTASSLAELYRSAEMVIVASYEESFSLAAAEAQCCGTPVIVPLGTGAEATRIHPYGAAFHKRSDWGLYRALMSVLKSPISPLHRQVLASMAHQRWSPQTIGNQYLKVYERALEKPKAR